MGLLFRRISVGAMYSRCCSVMQTERCFRKTHCCSFVLFSGAYCCGLLFTLMESFKEKCKAVFSVGCFGCCAKPSTSVAVDEQSTGLRTQERTVKRSSRLDDLWSTSTGEMEDSAIQSQRSISSVSGFNQPFEGSANSSSTSYSSEFVNHGLLLWNQTRQQWLGNKKSQNSTQVREPTISWNATYESLLGNNKPFSRPIPLSEMVDFLVDVWEQEGLYD